jgi:hypothetical protein
MVIGIIPNKNDGWILEANLKILSKLCDKVIVGLDDCQDNSESIIKKFKNTLIVNNFNSELAKHKPNRRQALLEKAREFAIKPVIVAVDTDEIFSEEILKEKNLKIIKNLDFETVLEVKFKELWFSPFLYRSEKKSIWAGRRMPCIWRDNGENYNLNNWHEERVPKKNKNKLLDVELVHFARTQPIKYWSKIRYYIARDVYINKKNTIKSNFHYAATHSEKDMVLSPVKKKWFPFLNNQFLFEIIKKDSAINWFNDEVLDYLLNDKSSSLKLADIWDFDWVEYYKIRKDKKPNINIINKLKDRRNFFQKKIVYHIRMKNSYPIFLIYFYTYWITIILTKIKLDKLVRVIYSKFKNFSYYFLS